jgi:hypothetical protein
MGSGLSMTHAQLLALQRTAGNAAVTQLITAQRCGTEENGGECLECGRPAATAQVQRQVTPAAATATTDAGAATTASADAGTKAVCPLKDFSGSNFTGDTARIDSDFEASMNSISAAAVKNDVLVHVTSSFRTSTVVPGAVVTPVDKSNHMVGHAIDMNVEYGKKHASYCNSTCLGGTLPAAVKGFIDDVKAAGLRWGGDFSDKDPVHFDDGLNVDNPTGWDARYKLIHDSCP